MSTNRKSPCKPIIIIPSRMGSTRLPQKPLADIHGDPMIVHVVRRALESEIGPVAVACDDQRIMDAVVPMGVRAVLTRVNHTSGSDRIWEAFQSLSDKESYDAVINVQGDEPTLDKRVIQTAWDLLKDPKVDIATVAAIIKDDAKKSLPQVVKPAIDLEIGATHGRALYFSRMAIPSGEGPLYHHVGLYAYRRDALEAFVSAPPSPLERRESLEQLRALSLGLHVEVAIVDTVPRGVDTSQDLDDVRKVLVKR